MRTQLTISLTLFLLFTGCTKDRNKINSYSAAIPFSTEYNKSIEIDIINDSAFVIHTSYLTPGDMSDAIGYLTISSGKIYKINNYFYAKDELSGEIIIYSKQSNSLKLYNSRYAELCFKENLENDLNIDSETEEDFYRRKDFFNRTAIDLKSYTDKSKVQVPHSIEKDELNKDSIIEFSNHCGLSLILNRDSTYFYTIENLLFSTGNWRFENDSLIITESITFRNKKFPSDLPENIMDFIEQNPNIYTALMLNDSTLFMGTLPFAQSCEKMTRTKPGFRYKFFESLMPPKPSQMPTI